MPAANVAAKEAPPITTSPTFSERFMANPALGVIEAETEQNSVRTAPANCVASITGN